MTYFVIVLALVAYLVVGRLIAMSALRWRLRNPRPDEPLESDIAALLVLMIMALWPLCLLTLAGYIGVSVLRLSLNAMGGHAIDRAGRR